MDDDTRTTAERRAAGEDVVRRMFGEEFLQRTMGRVPGIKEDEGAASGEGAGAALGRFALEQCYGDVWTRPELALRDRSLVTLGILIGLRQPDELRNHVLGALGNGLTPEELAEIALHSAPYVGLPAAGQAMRVVLQTLASQAPNAQSDFD